jgi:hypothetical protein
MTVEGLVKQRFCELDKRASEDILVMGPDGSLSVDSETCHGWATSVLSLLQRAFGEDSAHYRLFSDHYAKFFGYVWEFEACRGVFRAAKEDYEGGYLFNVRSLIKAELLSDDVLDQAKALLASGYKDPACILAGVALEVTLKEMCGRSGIELGKSDKMNGDLCKAEKYNMAKQKQITAWIDLRNKAAHGEWNAYDRADVDAFLEGIERFVGDYL